eukprot:gene10280-biopygen3783
MSRIGCRDLDTHLAAGRVATRRTAAQLQHCVRQRRVKAWRADYVYYSDADQVLWIHSVGALYHAASLGYAVAPTRMDLLPTVGPVRYGPTSTWNTHERCIKAKFRNTKRCQPYNHLNHFYLNGTGLLARGMIQC